LIDLQNIEKNIALRQLGHVILCGALHVAYATSDGVKGVYMMCALYRNSLLLASLNKIPGAYRVAAIISLVNGNIDTAENGRGMYCDTGIPYQVLMATYRIAMSHVPFHLEANIQRWWT
jgi:hypothetical protein